MMAAKDVEFLKRLKGIFQLEAEEHLQALTAGLLELEQTPTPARNVEIIETIFRETHSLKGAARSVSLTEIESLCQPLESAFAALKRQEIIVSPALCVLFQQVVDAMRGLVSSAEADVLPTERAHVRALVRQLGQVGSTTTVAEPPARPQPAEEPPVAALASPLVPSLPPLPVAESATPLRTSVEETLILAGTVRIPTARLDALLLQAEEFNLVKMTASQRTAEVRKIHHALLSWKTASARWDDRESTARLSQSIAWQRWNATQLSALESQVTMLIQTLEGDERSIKRLVDEHLDAMKQVLMLPVTTLVEAFPKVVRDLAHDQGKEVELVMHGVEIEIDKRIIEELKDPLIHLLRNCVDHGIREPAERESRHKLPRGTITLAFSTTDSRQVEILLSDDGVGIDIAQVRAAAIKARDISQDAAEKLDAQELVSLIFHSGVTTSPMITDISGRGLGLAIVREKVEKLGGVVSVDTQPHVGTTFRLRLPLTLATFRGVLVRVDEYAFVLPTLNVLRALRVRHAAIQTVENRETIQVDGGVLSLVRLGDALGLPLRKQSALAISTMSDIVRDTLSIVILASADKRMAFQVDEVLDEQQVMVKGLGKQLKRVRNVAGVTVLGNGKVVPVLNVADLMRSALRIVASARVRPEEAPSHKGRLLVAEDSITARTLLKNILETAGYQVTTAVDGADAFTQARNGEFDLIVSDVDMPRMSGFELTTRIRTDTKLAAVPVVLVTALDSREDRERGMDAGANAYIVKSSFDQSNLLEVIQQLL
jgi:two-component system chemotaxis sensor kinase CheA